MLFVVLFWGAFFMTHTQMFVWTLFEYSHVPSNARPRTCELIRRVIAEIDIKEEDQSVSFLNV